MPIWSTTATSSNDLISPVGPLSWAPSSPPAVDPMPHPEPLHQEPLHPKPLHSEALPQEASPTVGFSPPPLTSLADTGLPQSAIEDLLFKHLLAQGELTGRELARALAVPFNCLEALLGDLKNRLLIVYKNAGSLGDFSYMLTDLGREKAIVARQACAYTGPVPVPLSHYLTAMAGQTLTTENPQAPDLAQAFNDLVLSEAMVEALGPAINAGKGLFLYGAPGNGKTSIAERICKAYKGFLFIPYTLWVEGQLILLYDTETHRPLMPATAQAGLGLYDKRWIAIERPVIVVGGELSLDALELKYNDVLKVCEAPLQLKANGGLFMIDDFGRQRVQPDALLNRWIVPLEKRIDYLTLPTGKKIQVPFDEFIIFSTNLNPKDLVDEAFLRRIPYKIEVPDPSEATFRQLLQSMSAKYGMAPDPAAWDYLIATHYHGKQRPFRACQARDLTDQVVNLCKFKGQAPYWSQDFVDRACFTYFSAVGG
jgi:hypothetical protein